MCGFTGFWDKDLAFGFSKAALDNLAEKMADKIDHRGPDSHGIWTEEKSGIALGHRRLSIVDLSPAGHQPMISASGNLMMAYNGEVYNTENVRKELTAYGETLNQPALFRGYSDTEVILRACEIFGVEATCKKLIGMFAFALWDAKNECLYLARDRLGKKPLYWGFQNRVLFFGSQIKSFYVHPAWRAEIDQDALASYFRFNYVPAPISIFKNIHKLSPGVVLKINKQGHIQENRFWDFSEVVERGMQERAFRKNDKEATDALEALLKDAVKGRMMADVPLGAFLSGGVDSSTVVALMQAQSSKPIKTFSIGFYEEGYNEAKHAKSVAVHLGTEHYELYVNPQEIFDVIPKIPEWFDEPFADCSQIPTYLVSKMAREHVTVALSGDGGDELFAGYTRYFQGEHIWNSINLLPVWIRSMLASGIKALKPNTLNTLAKVLPSKMRPAQFADKMQKASEVLPIQDPINFYKRIVSQWQNPNELVLLGKEPDLFPWKDLEKKHLKNIVEYMQVMDTLSYLPDDILSKVDRASMAVSLEARTPLLDHRVVEMAWQLPMDQKIRNNQGKWLLRQVLYRYVPKTLIERPKMGFGVPIGDWLRKELRPWAEELMFDPNVKSDGILNTALMQQKWSEHVAGTRNWQYPLWGVLMFLSWKKSWGF